MNNQNQKKEEPCQGDCQVAIETKKKMQEATSELEQEKDKNSALSAQLEEAKVKFSTLEKVQNEKEHLEKERELVEQQLKEEKQKSARLQEEVGELQTNVKNAADQVRKFIT